MRIFKQNAVKSSMLVLIALCLFSTAYSQPSGGPYGPMQLNYELPKVNGTIYYVSPEGDEKAKGKTLDKPTTIEAATKKVVTGDAIVMRGGVYRTGKLIINQRIIIQPYQDELPVLKGTYVASEWRSLRHGLWKTKWDYLYPSGPEDWWHKDSEIKLTPLYKFNDDMVFINGEFLQAVGSPSEVDENTFFVDYENSEIYIGQDPKDKLVEITAFNVAIQVVHHKINGKVPDGKGPTIKGLKITQYSDTALLIHGTDPTKLSHESEFGKDVVGTTIENCDISYCSRQGAYLMGDSLIIRNCKFSNTSREGLYIVASCDVLLERNIFTLNNIENITGCYPSGVKIFNQTYRVTCNDNLLTNMPNSNGIWYDVGNVDGVFTNNWIENVGTIKFPTSNENIWNAHNGFFFEISKGVRLSGNVFVNCDHGFLILNSSGSKIYNNTFVNSQACYGRDGRSAQGDHFGFHPSTGPDVEERINHEFVNNILVGNENYNWPLLSVWQNEKLCDRLKEPALSQLNNNVYVKMRNDTLPIVWLGQKIGDNCTFQYRDVDALNQSIKGYGKNSVSLLNYNGPLFKSLELENFQLLDGFKAPNVGAELPDYIKEINTINTKPYIGAYPSK